MSGIHSAESKPWTFTVVRAHGLHQLRAGRSWRPIVTVTVDDHQCHELNLGCDGQNPNLKHCFQLHMRVPPGAKQEEDKKEESRGERVLYAARIGTSPGSAAVQAKKLVTLLNECPEPVPSDVVMGKGVEIKLNSVSRQKGGGANKARFSPVLLVAKLDLPQISKARTICAEDDTKSDIMSEDSEDQEYSSSPPSTSSEAPSFVWPEAVHDPEPKVHTGYWSDSDRTRSEDERDPLYTRQKNEPIIIAQFTDEEEKDSDIVKGSGRRLWLAASMLPTYTEVIIVDSRASTIDSIVDAFSPHRELREARVDSDYERVLNKLCSEWRFVGGSLVALAGLEAGVFGFSSASVFTVGRFAQGAIAIGSIASGIGLAIDAWFLLAYCNVTPAKFQKMALDVYGKYVFFCISARIPAFCMFTSAVALMVFLLSVAWTAWPTAVLVMSFVAGMLVSLQFIVYGMHCVVFFVMEVMRGVRRGVMRCLAWIHPSSPASVQEKHTTEK